MSDHNSQEILRLEQVSKRYIEGTQQHLVLNNVDAHFNPGEITAVRGQSGSGKSTLLNLISGIDNVDGGKICLGDRELTRLSERERTLFRRRSIGFLFQFFNLIPTLTVWENVTLPIELKGAHNSKQFDNAERLLERVGLSDRKSSYPDVLSGGEQQRVALVRALAHDPLILLADEPTGNLDESTSATVLALLEELTREAGKTLILVTHSNEVAAIADRCLILKNQVLSEEVSGM